MKISIRRIGLSLLGAVLAAIAGSTLASSFDDDLERVDHALRENPRGALRQSLESCAKQRNYAVRLQRMGLATQARRSLNYCFDSLRIPRTGPVGKVKALTPEQLRAKAKREYDKALALKPDLANGLEVYRECAACHEPEGWGLPSGNVPQIAGQHRSVVIKQLADFRAGNRDSGIMAPYAAAEVVGGAQAIADVAAYVSTLEINVTNGKGTGEDLDLGKELYQKYCTDCHGASGEGDADKHIPRIQAQHYSYLTRQFKKIQDGKRHNAHPEMVEQISLMEDREINAVLDYTSRLLPAEELRAPADWKNPDFN